MHVSFRGFQVWFFFYAYMHVTEVHNLILLARFFSYLLRVISFSTNEDRNDGDILIVFIWIIYRRGLITRNVKAAVDLFHDRFSVSILKYTSWYKKSFL